jgi:hypothetical protein
MAIPPGTKDKAKCSLIAANRVQSEAFAAWL